MQYFRKSTISQTNFHGSHCFLFVVKAGKRYAKSQDENLSWGIPCTRENNRKDNYLQKLGHRKKKKSVSEGSYQIYRMAKYLHNLNSAP